MPKRTPNLWHRLVRKFRLEPSWTPAVGVLASGVTWGCDGFTVSRSAFSSSQDKTPECPFSPLNLKFLSMHSWCMGLTMFVLPPGLPARLTDRLLWDQAPWKSLWESLIAASPYQVPSCLTITASPSGFVWLPWVLRAHITYYLPSIIILQPRATLTSPTQLWVFKDNNKKVYYFICYVPVKKSLMTSS